MLLYVSIALLVFAGLSKALRDRVMTGYDGSKLKSWGLNRRWWDSRMSWMNKWRRGSAGEPLPGKERFPGSSTFFVWITDAWHFFDLLFMISFGLGILLAPLGFWISLVITLAVFEGVYSWLRKVE